MRTVGIVLVIIGLIMTIYSGFTYTTEKKVIDIGPIEVNKEQDHPVNWSPIVGGIVLVGGIVILVTSKKR